MYSTIKSDSISNTGCDDYQKLQPPSIGPTRQITKTNIHLLIHYLNMLEMKRHKRRVDHYLKC